MDELQPVAVDGGYQFGSLADGIGYHFCGRRVDGRVLCWGWNADGQLGIGSLSDAPTPTLLPQFAGLLAGPGSIQALGLAPSDTRRMPYLHRRPR